MSLPPERLLVDLGILLPRLDVVPFWEEPGAATYLGDALCFRHQLLFVDGLPLYVVPDQITSREMPGYIGWIHKGFQVWLYHRGWWCFPFAHGQLYLLVPNGDPAWLLYEQSDGPT